MIKNELSEELLSNILQLDIDFFYYSETYNKIHMYVTCPITYERYEKSINIYELAHKCKKSAFENGYILHSCYLPNNGIISSYVVIVEFSTNLNLKEIHEDSEEEAIFKAYEWILEKKRGKEND